MMMRHILPEFPGDGFEFIKVGEYIYPKKAQVWENENLDGVQLPHWRPWYGNIPYLNDGERVFRRQTTKEIVL